MHIILRFPPMAGGNFVANCLSLNKRILHTDYFYAKKRLHKSMTAHQRFGVSMYPVIKSYMSNGHWEYCGWYEMGTKVCGLSWPGGTCESATTKYTQQDVDEAKEFVDSVNNQDHYHSVILARPPDHPTLTNDKFKNQVHVRAVNVNYLAEHRKEKIIPYNKTNGVDTIDFDMDTIQSKKDFYDELCKVTNYLQIDPIEYDLVKTMLSTWMPGITLITDGHINENKHFFKEKFAMYRKENKI